MVSRTEYASIIDTIKSWAENDPNIKVVIIIGSQVQKAAKVDIWSDLDTMILLDNPETLLMDDGWIGNFGNPVCSYVDTTKLSFVEWDWSVKRVLYEKNLDVDFSILPISHLDSVLSVNKDIISKGYRIIYDPTNLVEKKIISLNQEEKNVKISILNKSELKNIVNDILYHIVWTEKKIRRGELWVAVNTINNHLNYQLLRLLETQNQTTSEIMYEGRYLETRTEKDLLDKLSQCFTRYDSEEASITLKNILELTHTIFDKLFTERDNEYLFKFQRIRELREGITSSDRIIPYQDNI